MAKVTIDDVLESIDDWTMLEVRSHQADRGRYGVRGGPHGVRPWRPRGRRRRGGGRREEEF